MPRFIITGNYTQSAAQGMIANPSDRGAATGALVAAAGGTMEAYYATTGPSDFMLIVSGTDIDGVMAALIVAGASGAVSNMQTQRAFTSAELLEFQKSAAGLAAAYTAPG